MLITHLKYLELSSLLNVYLAVWNFSSKCKKSCTTCFKTFLIYTNLHACYHALIFCASLCVYVYLPNTFKAFFTLKCVGMKTAVTNNLDKLIVT